MKYMLLIHTDEKHCATRSAADDQKEMAAHGVFCEALGSKLLGGDRLATESRARRISMQTGSRVVKDGPFAETKEVLGGYYLIECPSAEEALSWAERCPSAAHGTIEVRPVWAP